MQVFQGFLDGIADPAHRQRVTEILEWVKDSFPSLEPVFKWNQPMFTDHGTFIIGFSVAKPHMAVAPEGAGIRHFEADFKRLGYSHGSKFFRIPWTSPVDYDFLAKVIAFNIEDKKDLKAFWRPNDC